MSAPTILVCEANWDNGSRPGLEDKNQNVPAYWRDFLCNKRSLQLILQSSIIASILYMAVESPIGIVSLFQQVHKDPSVYSSRYHDTNHAGDCDANIKRFIGKLQEHKIDTSSLRVATLWCKTQNRIVNFRVPNDLLRPEEQDVENPDTQMDHHTILLGPLDEVYDLSIGLEVRDNKSSHKHSLVGIHFMQYVRVLIGNIIIPADRYRVKLGIREDIDELVQVTVYPAHAFADSNSRDINGKGINYTLRQYVASRRNFQ